MPRLRRRALIGVLGFLFPVLFHSQPGASHCLNGSAFLDGIDWIILSIFFVFAQSVSLDLLSSACNFNCTIFSYTSKPSSSNFLFKSDQYLLGIELSVRAKIMSIIEKYHSLLCHVLLIFLSWKTTNLLSLFFESLFLDIFIRLFFNYLRIIMMGNR